MATMSAASHRCCASSLRALTVLFVLAALVSDVGGRHHHHVCRPYFSCGGFSNISYPFRRQGDPSGCGVQSYELVCTDTDATIRIGSGTYTVLSINSTYSYFWVVDANLDIQSSCPLPWWDYHGIPVPKNTSYPDVVKLMRNGFGLRFPSSIGDRGIRECFAESVRNFLKEPRKYQIVDILMVEELWSCFLDQHGSTNNVVTSVIIDIIKTIPICMWLLKSTHVFCRLVLMPLAVFVFLAHKYWKARITIDAVEKFLRMQQMLVPMRYAYTNIIAITGHFREKLGQGGYGSVYKGVLQPGEVHVAVKMLGNSNCNGEEFISEVATIGKIHHFNVVRLIGFCSEENSRALIYEFMPHGSLDKYIFSSEKSFSWDKLNEIALGIARGLNYLHHGCDMQIVHFDIKPHNILLDSNFVPKVADFGLAKLFPRDDSFVPLSAMRGTIGYIAPEMVSRSFGVISSKSDVYSFGMLLLEMTGGRRNADPHAGSSSQAYYPSLVYNQLSQGDVGEISEGVDMHELKKKLCIIGLWCIQMKPQDRPTMSEVIEMLEAGVDGIQMPSRPFFCDDEGDSSYSAISELDTIEE
ncbi:rust resistance kinase Lr10 isoform X2 [Zea mays]|uniref:Protein kinase domain-containing protein n=1 Tax=Zea mays TaxID=4577 RepID=A0A804QI90_MAIZE|nr:rust resistance kinase Lr10 isoform X2 [Zea mays]|eukprot:XP_008655563.1 rust resistance kinase Lr10 isoform X2 [Zea mays]